MPSNQHTQTLIIFSVKIYTSFERTRSVSLPAALSYLQGYQWNRSNTILDGVLLLEKGYIGESLQEVDKISMVIFQSAFTDSSPHPSGDIITDILALFQY